MDHRYCRLLVEGIVYVDYECDPHRTDAYEEHISDRNFNYNVHSGSESDPEVRLCMSRNRLVNVAWKEMVQ